MGDSQVDGQQTMVFTLEKQNGDWLIWDVDLEELAGLQVENARAPGILSRGVARFRVSRAPTRLSCCRAFEKCWI
jgi:hypothetical protein